MAQKIETPSVFIEELTWKEVGAFIEAGGTSVIVPIGGTEQNGPMMTMGKHNYRIKYMGELIAKELGNALVTPTMAYVPEGNIEPASGWMKYPGTITLPEEHYKRVIEFTCRSMKKHGFEDIFLIGDSGDNQKGMREVAEALNAEWSAESARVHFVSDYYGKPYGSVYDTLVAEGYTKQELGAHAGILDVSFLLAIHKKGIRKSLISQYNSLSDAKKSELGFSGDMSKISKKIGQMMIDETLRISLEQIKKMKGN